MPEAANRGIKLTKKGRGTTQSVSFIPPTPFYNKGEGKKRLQKS
jgi:hypothetical protein